MPQPTEADALLDLIRIYTDRARDYLRTGRRSMAEYAARQADKHRARLAQLTTA